MQKNIFNEDIEECCTNPITGFYRDGFCNTDQLDFGTHTVCTLITNDFLDFSKSMGNDLSTPQVVNNSLNSKSGINYFDFKDFDPWR